MTPKEKNIIVKAISLERTLKKRYFEKDDEVGYKVHCRCEKLLTEILKKLGGEAPMIREECLHPKKKRISIKSPVKIVKPNIKLIKKVGKFKHIFLTYFSKEEKQLLLKKHMKAGSSFDKAKGQVKDFIDKLKLMEEKIRKKRLNQDHEDKKINETFQKEFEKICMRLESER